MNTALQIRLLEEEVESLKGQVQRSEQRAEIMQRERDHYKNSLDQFLDIEVKRIKLSVPTPLVLTGVEIDS